MGSAGFSHSRTWAVGAAIIANVAHHCGRRKTELNSVLHYHLNGLAQKWNVLTTHWPKPITWPLPNHKGAKKYNLIIWPENSQPEIFDEPRWWLMMTIPLDFKDPFKYDTTDDSQKHYAKKPERLYSVWFHSYDIWKRQNDRDRNQISGCQRGTRALFQAMITWLCQLLETQRNVRLKRANFTICKLYVNKSWKKERLNSLFNHWRHLKVLLEIVLQQDRN